MHGDCTDDAIVVPVTAQFLNSPFTEDEALAYVRRWCDLLVEQDYEAAFGMTAHYSYNDMSPGWMRTLVESCDYLEPPPLGLFKVTPVESAKLPVGRSQPRHDVRFFGAPDSSERDDARPFYAQIWFDLPLNGEWSELAATFDVFSRGESAIVVLDEIRVF